MPGHIKLVKGAVDPDPTEFLLPSMDMKKADQNKPYEPKKSVWVPGLSCSQNQYNGNGLRWAKIADYPRSQNRRIPGGFPGVGRRNC